MDEIEPIKAALTAAGIAYVCDGRVLLIKRSATADAHPSTWSFPAGGIEDGETPAEAAARESQEEIAHAPGELVAIEERDGFALFLCQTDEFAPVLNDESAGYAWVAPDDLPTPLHPQVQEQVILAMAAATAPRVDVAMDESARTIDTNGWFEVEGNPISKVGVFPYRGRQLPGKASEPDRLFQVYRPAEELSDPECVTSFRLLPWIDNHVMLGDPAKGLMPAERKGVQGVVGEQIAFDSELGDHGGLRANVKVFSQALANLIASGKRELSLGYRCKYDWTPGTTPWGEAYDCVQRVIRGNHLASVKSGRMGPDVAVLDSSDDQSTTATKEPLMADEKNGGGSSMTLDAALQLVKDAMPAIMMIREAGMLTDAMLSGQVPITSLVVDAGVDDGKKPGDDANPGDKKDDKPNASAKDDAGGTEGKKDDKTEKDDKGGAAMDAAPSLTLKDLLGQVSRRDKLAKQLSAHVGTFDHSEMTEAEVASYGIKKLGLAVAAGQELGALAGFLAAKGNPAAAPVAKPTSHAMDGAPRAGSAVSRFLNTEA